jgi:hypothetical protein
MSLKGDTVFIDKKRLYMNANALNKLKMSEQEFSD